MIPLYFLEVGPLATACTLGCCFTFCWVATTAYKRAKLPPKATDRPVKKSEQ